MRLSTLIAGLAVLALPLAGCAKDAEDVVPAPQPGSPPSEGAGGAAVPAGRVDGSALPESYPRQVVVTGQGRKLLITAQEGGCVRVSAEVGEQTSREVAVALVHTAPTGSPICTRDIRYPEVPVRLDAPLGARTVVLTAVERVG